MTDSGDEQEGYIVEFVQVGKSIKVTAVDPKSLIEVSIVGNPKSTQKELMKVAIRKLQYVLNKQKDA